jgi:ABC-type multidrug transport system ATPase subunit
MITWHRIIFSSNVALNGVNFQIPQGCVTAILGPNGAGKTTAIRILAGSLLADAGRAEVGGICVADYPLEAKKQIGYLPENNPLWQDMTVEETLAFSLVPENSSTLFRLSYLIFGLYMIYYPVFHSFLGKLFSKK